ncbi:MAG: Phosphate-starvation-inducible E [uncultured Thiotrichaceae bacterium]|uniref:Protein PsiE n=1 Tax=uncultured Thiotrichaceae bacterium TaxID=298394 RepID=A0A6S6U2H3_9GAMM|nr:MAG: Phosphate-starvation-inducible E [uncultured Thiotrichaceae bacterium]
MRDDIVLKALFFIEQVALFFILLATLYAFGEEIMLIIKNRHVSLSDLLLLFIYMEVIAMIGIYYEDHALPIRYPIYIAIIALARFLILDSKDLSWYAMMGVGATILILTIAIFVHRYGSIKLPYKSRRSSIKSDPD